MFSTQLGRVARAGSQAASHSTCARTANSCASLTPAAVLTRPRQQRRLSSSKASCPPNAGDSNRARQADPAQTAAEAARPTQRNSNASSHSSGRKSIKTKASKDKDEVFDRLPSVPSTHHLHPSDISLSSFFSMHRPLSLTATIPPQTNIDTFNDIFTPKSNTSASQSSNPADVIYTLRNSIDRLESASSSSTPDEGPRWEIIQESSSDSDVKHLDGVPRAKTLEELIAQFRPFQAPPPPMPAAVTSTSAPATRRATTQKQSQKSFKTTIIVTEKTGADGSKTYTAATTPMEPIKEPVKRTPFLDRMRRREFGREVEEGEGMMAISVKRQRKLKMKKHKYKKLMKRTRNLRRRLDRN